VTGAILAREEEGARASLSGLPCFLLYVGWRKAQALYRPLLGGQTPQRMYLLHLLREQEVMSVSSVATAMEMEIAGASGLLTRMEKEGLVERQRSRTNGLERLCSLTPRGARTYLELSREVEALDRQLLDRLADGDLQALANLVMSLRELRGDAPPLETSRWKGE
jgi:MarR family transcriptional regulator, organic hydroperoxide resistance regulator